MLKSLVILQAVMGNQRSIKNIVSIEGKGLHSGKLSKVTLKPAGVDAGVFFRRVDLEHSPLLEASCRLTGKTSRNTTIEKDNISISTIEHLMAALRASNIDNIEIEVNCEEVPILDGSAKYWIDLLKKAEVVEQDKKKKIYKNIKRF